MKWTNHHNLPEPLVRAITREPERPKGEFEVGVSELIAPVRQTILRQRHGDKIEQDVSDGIWRLLGSAVHAVLEKSDPEKKSNTLIEERLETIVQTPGGEWTIIGHPDLLEADGTLSDYKVTSVWSFILGDKPEWEQQLNVYRFLYAEQGFDVWRLRIIGILKDWKPRDAGYKAVWTGRADAFGEEIYYLKYIGEPKNKDYPRINVITKNIPMWPISATHEFINHRLKMLQESKNIPDDELVLCTPEERWTKNDTWAVKKKGQKRAVRVYEKANEAEAHAMSDGKLVIEHRPGTDTRCVAYCDVAPFCSYAKAKYGI